ncbi:MAG: hypothetical protein IH956_03850 [Chloroflexi bacterium]|nr:hypothetical protein [Chloroflexota bacterium]
MSESTIRVSLPSGGWWDLTTRPLWRHVRHWMDEGPDHDLLPRALVSLTTGWSFPEGVTERSLALRDTEDLTTVLAVLNGEVLSAFRSGGPREAAEALFEGLVSGRVPREYLEVCLMAATGWTWQALGETPADIVHKMAVYLAVKGIRDTKGTLQFSEED